MIGPVSAQQVFNDALDLDEDARIELARLLLDSCEPRDPDWWTRVAPEVEQRLADLDSGRVKAVGYDDIRKRMYERVRAGQG